MGTIVRFIFAILIFSLISCSNNEAIDLSVIELPYYFEDGFEVDGNDLTELLQSDNSRWSHIQQVDPETGMNDISINKLNFSEGNNSLQIISQPSGNTLSKIDIEKEVSLHQ